MLVGLVRFERVTQCRDRIVDAVEIVGEHVRTLGPPERTALRRAFAGCPLEQRSEIVVALGAQVRAAGGRERRMTRRRRTGGLTVELERTRTVTELFVDDTEPLEERGELRWVADVRDHLLEDIGELFPLAFLL